MTLCPQCESLLVQCPPAAGRNAPTWADCVNCGWPLQRDEMWRRATAAEGKVHTVILIREDGTDFQTVTGPRVAEIMDSLRAGLRRACPFCQSGQMVAFRLDKRIYFLLMGHETVAKALAAVSRS